MFISDCVHFYVLMSNLWYLTICIEALSDSIRGVWSVAGINQAFPSHPFPPGQAGVCSHPTHLHNLTGCDGMSAGSMLLRELERSLQEWRSNAPSEESLTVWLVYGSDRLDA